ncbi:PAS domain S-box protein [Roseibium sp.]|uniref:PAS domain S-box protein n=1 Tax=Roseibium sp. TaxID=1936156 RepID=UPI003A9862B9
MDNRLQTFMELSAAAELDGLCSDPHAAWVWSADGTRVLWANAAGAAFFSVRHWDGLDRLDGLHRSPARPHIARIATEGPGDRTTIDRLRFYRGLRVMLLTCQCRRITLPGGQDAALIICADKGLAFDGAPLPAYLRLLADDVHTAFLFDGETVADQAGSLTGTPEWLDLPDGQSSLFGPIDLEANFHEGAIAQISGTHRIVVLENAPLADETSSAVVDDSETGTEPTETTQEVAEQLDTGTVAANELEQNASLEQSDAEAQEATTDIDTAGGSAAADVTAEEPVEVPTSGSDDETTHDVAADDDFDSTDTEGSETGSIWSRAQDLADETTDDLEEDDLFEAPGENEGQLEDATETFTVPPLVRPDAAASGTNDFQFIYRRRPVRFAWKMDIDQRFTFISEEFAETLGPSAANVVGLTWAEVAEQFDLDVTGSISRALDRRDTWSGKTVDWPVSGAPLRVPVDMAALPAFDRNKDFEGYRGFGVCRTADAADDPLAPLLAGPDDIKNTPIQELDASTDADALSGGPSQDQDAAALLHEALAIAGEDSTTAGTEAERSDDRAAFVDAMAVSETVDEQSTAKTETTEPDTAEEDAAPFADDTHELTLDDIAEDKAPEIDLTPAPKAPFSGKTLLGASTAALLGSLPFSERKSKMSPPPTVTPEHGPGETDPTSAENPDATDVSGEVEADESDIAGEEAIETGEKDTDELAGISGTAPLHPREIETAVKSLAKDFGRKPKDQQPLKNGDSSAGEKHAQETAAEQASEAQETQVDLEDLVAQAETADEEIGDTARSESDDEREFYEETAAFSGEDEETEAHEAGDDIIELTDTSEPLVPGHTPTSLLTLISGQNDNGPDTTSANDADDDGKVVSITRKPHLVPVDTSRLSKPEKAAFRKIAEALGARLEGDMEEDGFDEELERELAEAETLPPAGPIDPRLLDRLPIGIAIAHDRDILYANDTLLDLLGYGTLKALSEAGGLEAVFVEDDDDTWPDADGMEGTVDDTLKVRMADGGVRPVDARMHSVPWNGGRGLMISFTERTPGEPRRETTAQVVEMPAVAKSDDLRQAEDLIAELDTILETATDGVLVLDRHGSITKVNRSAEALFGASRSDMEGAPLTDFLAPESHRAAADYLDGLSRNGVASILNDGREVLGRVASGGLIPLFMTIGKVSTSGDEPKFCAVLRDITQWKTAEEELTQAKRQAENASSQKSDFLAKISHEIRTPLNAIIGFSEVMMEERFGAIGNERYKEYLRDIRTSGSHIMSLINDLLDLSKIEAGKMDLRFSAVSANEVINECVALMQPQANRERVIIRASLPDSVPSVVADQRSLRQIVLNLLSNAIKFNKSGGQVIVSSSLEDNGEVVLRVRDTGTGMSAKDLSAALEPFRQVHTARHGGGTGLGLPLTKALVEANRAGFHIDSTPDQGTLVEIRFPSQRVLAE